MIGLTLLVRYHEEKLLWAVADMMLRLRMVLRDPEPHLRSFAPANVFRSPEMWIEVVKANRSPF